MARLHPALNALSMERHEECSSAIVREWEKETFLQQNGIEGWTDENHAANYAKGVHLAAIIAAVPLMPDGYKLSSIEQGIGGKKQKVVASGEMISPRVRARAIRAAIRSFPEVKIEPGDFAFVADVTRKRDAALGNVITAAGGVGCIVRTPEGANSVGEIEVRWHRSARMKHAPRVTADVDARYLIDGSAGIHALACDWRTGFLTLPVDESNRHVRTIAAMESLLSEPHSVTIAMLSRNNAEPGVIDFATFNRAEQEQLVDWLGELATKTEERYKRYAESKGPDGSPGPHMAAALDRNANVGPHCGRCTGGVCCGKLLGELEQARVKVESYMPQIVKGRAWIKTTTTQQPQSLNPMNANALSENLEVAKTASEALALSENVWKEGSELARQLAAKKIAVPGFGLKDGARLLKQRDAKQTPAEIWKALQDLLPGVTFQEFVAKACDVDPKAVEAMIADKHDLDPAEVFNVKLDPLGPNNPFELRANKPSVIRANKKIVIDAAPVPLPEERQAKASSVARAKP